MCLQKHRFLKEGGAQQLPLDHYKQGLVSHRQHLVIRRYREKGTQYLLGCVCHVKDTIGFESGDKKPNRKKIGRQCGNEST